MVRRSLGSIVLVDWDGEPWTAVTRRADEVIAEAEPLGWRAVTVRHESQRQFGVMTLERVAMEEEVPS